MVTTFLFDSIQKLGARSLGPRLRSIGLRVYQAGLRIGGTDATFESVLPQAERIRVGDRQPQIGFAKLIGQGTSIVGNVVVADNSVINFNNLIQAGPGATINIAKNASIQDLTVIKADQGKTVDIGENALICSNAYLRNCTVASNAVVGIGAKAYDGCVIEGMLGAGSVLLEGETVPEGEIWVGNPAVFVRRLTEEERDHNKDLVFHYSKVAETIEEEMKKPIEEQMLLEDLRNDIMEPEISMMHYQTLEKARTEGLPFADEDYLTPKRIIDIANFDDLNKEIKGKKMSEDYVYNYEDHPRNFNNHKANYRVHNELKDRIDTDADIQRPDLSHYEKGTDVAKPENWTRKY